MYCCATLRKSLPPNDAISLAGEQPTTACGFTRGDLSAAQPSHDLRDRCSNVIPQPPPGGGCGRSHMSKRTGADLLAEALVTEGVDTVFGLPGLQLDPAMEAM